MTAAVAALLEAYKGYQVSMGEEAARFAGEVSAEERLVDAPALKKPSGAPKVSKNAKVGKCKVGTASGIVHGALSNAKLSITSDAKPRAELVANIEGVRRHIFTLHKHTFGEHFAVCANYVKEMIGAAGPMTKAQAIRAKDEWVPR
jgi:hypothetical protein